MIPQYNSMLPHLGTIRPPPIFYLAFLPTASALALPTETPADRPDTPFMCTHQSLVKMTVPWGWARLFKRSLTALVLSPSLQ
jgi:hypothetical protein